MSTRRVNLDTTQYVRVTTDPLTPSSLILQSHRDTVRIVFSDVKPSRDNEVFHELGDNDEPLYVDMTEQAVWALSMTNTAALTVTQQRVPIDISAEDTMGVTVYVADQTTNPLGLYFLQRLNTTTIVADTVVDTYQFTAATGHGIVVGNVIEINNTVSFIQAIVLNVAGDVITIDTLINHIYTSGSELIVSNKDIRVDGSVTPQVFSIKPTVNQSGHFTRLMLSILSNNNMDFSTFGSLPKLTRGCSLRVKRSDTEYVNLFTWKNNEEFIIRSFDHAFEDKIGGGEHAFTSKSTFGGQNERGVVLYLDGVNGDELQLVVQDNLSSGLTDFTMIAQGHDLQG